MARRIYIRSNLLPLHGTPLHAIEQTSNAYGCDYISVLADYFVRCCRLSVLALLCAIYNATRSRRIFFINPRRRQ